LFFDDPKIAHDSEHPDTTHIGATARATWFANAGDRNWFLGFFIRLRSAKHLVLNLEIAISFMTIYWTSQKE
jgi:hypothetical protein